jgi:hypothetical protein
MINVAVTIDLGTYSSGFGWVPINDLNHDPAHRRIHLCWQWPGQPFPYPKTLTALLLGSDGSVVAWGHEAHRKWREQQAEGRDLGLRPARWFKMNLLRRNDPAGAFTRLAVLLETRHAPQELITAYLKLMYQCALDALRMRGFQENEIRWCVTVPAQWSDRQKQIMRKAAAAAGMPAHDDRLILALEPEAAAHHARVSGVKLLNDESATAPSLTQPGIRFMVVDCGGGTVDLTAYRNDDNKQMVEIAKASGDALGSQCLNAAFVECVLVKRLGGVEEFQRLQRACPLEMEELIERWEQLKLHVRADETKPLELLLPFERRLSKAARQCLKDQQGGISSRIIVTAEEVRDIFEQVVEPILDLVDRQLAEMRDQDGPATGTEHVLLAGGFAASPYLQQRLSAHLEARAELLVLPDPAVAVLSGGCHFAYAPETRARRSRFTYGIAAALPFEEGVDPTDSKVLNAWGEPRCTRRFSVFVTSGQSIASGEEKSCTYYPLRGDQTSVTIAFYSCDGQAPRYIDGSTHCGRIRDRLSAFGSDRWLRSVTAALVR